MFRHEDHSTIVDSLERSELVTKLADAVMACKPPRVFGLHGDWGEGKTSVLQQLHCRLDGMPSREQWRDAQFDSVAPSLDQQRDVNDEWKCESLKGKIAFADRALVVWFEAWRYQHEASPVVALLHEMRGQLGALARAKMKAWMLTEVTVRSSLMVLGKLAGAIGNPIALAAGAADVVQSEGEKWERAHFAEQLPGEALREQLQGAIDQLLGNKPEQATDTSRRVIVLIDDLDRCEPHATFRLLEGIKIYLNIPNCVFVMGMDKRAIVDAIAQAAPGQKTDRAESHRRAREYLEKLFQSVYYLPKVQHIERHVLAWIPDDRTKLSKEDRAVVREMLQAYAGCLPANPRKLKGFASVLWRFLTEPTWRTEGQTLFAPLTNTKGVATQRRDIALAIIMAALHYSHPEIYRALEHDMDLFYKVLWDWCAGVDYRPPPPVQPGVTAIREQEHGPRFTQFSYECLNDVEPAFTSNKTADPGQDELPALSARPIDYSRGHVLRVQQLIYHARPFQTEQIRALLLR